MLHTTRLIKTRLQRESSENSAAPLPHFVSFPHMEQRNSPNLYFSTKKPFENFSAE
jgi:hypothetical protein